MGAMSHAGHKVHAWNWKGNPDSCSSLRSVRQAWWPSPAGGQCGVWERDLSHVCAVWGRGATWRHPLLAFAPGLVMTARGPTVPSQSPADARVADTPGTWVAGVKN